MSGRSEQVLKVECWCRARIMNVPASLVREGRTVLCGSDACKVARRKIIRAGMTR